LKKQHPADRLDHWTLQTTIFPETLWRQDQTLIDHLMKQKEREEDQKLNKNLNSKQEPRRSRVEE
jgi:hypothetical protein